jgi:predicted nucleotidyltransferase
MSKVGALLFGNARGRLLALLLLHPDQAFHLRRIARRCAISPGTVHRELAQLVEAGLVTSEAEGNLVRYRANRASPVFPELALLLKKTVGLVDVLRDALTPLADRIHVAAVYGSVARGEERSDSDVDLLVVGDVRFVEVVQTLHPAQDTIGRELSPTVYTAAEFRKAYHATDGFLPRVIQDRLLFVLGTEDDLGKLAPDRPAP